MLQLVSRRSVVGLRLGQSIQGSLKSTSSTLHPRVLSTSGPGYLKRQEQLGRPVSPHVTIYDFPLAAISSVTHRITGGMLTIGLYGMGFMALAGGDVGAVASSLGASAMGPAIKFSVAFPLIFHFAGGVRHFYWEKMPEGLNAQSQYQTAAALFGVSGALGVIAMVL